MKNIKSLIYPFAGILFALAILLGSFLHFFDWPNNEGYQSLIFGFGIFDALLLLLILFGELFSLKFDRTATKNTLFATLFLFAFFFSTFDFIASLKFLGITVNDAWIFFQRYINPHIGHLCFIFFLYFMSRFYTNDFGVTKKNHWVLLLFLPFLVLNIVFTSFNLTLIVLILSIVEWVFVLGFMLVVFNEINPHADNILIATFTFLLTLSFASANLFNQNDFARILKFPFLGMNHFFLAICAFSYIGIYIIFMVKKTKRAYELEDKEKEKNSAKVMLSVTCFETFDCFKDGEVLEFPSKKSKEFFALLVTLKGQSLSMDKAITYLWPDKDLDKAKVSYRDVIWKLRKFFIDINFHGVSFKRGMTTLDRSYIVCDYYDKLKKKQPIDNEKYMPEYNWSLDFDLDD